MNPFTDAGPLRNLLLVSGNDIALSGSAHLNRYAGGILAHEQFKITGNPAIRGFVVAEDGLSTWPGDPAPACGSALDLHCHEKGNKIHGSPNIEAIELDTEAFPMKLERLTWKEVVTNP